MATTAADFTNTYFKYGIAAQELVNNPDTCHLLIRTGWNHRWRVTILMNTDFQKPTKVQVARNLYSEYC